MTQDEQEIRSLLARWHGATAAGDVERVLTLMDEEVIFLVAGQAPMRGRAQFDQALRGVLATHQIISRGDIREIMVSGNFAYVWSVLEVSISAKTGGPVTVRTGNVLSILRKQENGPWLLFRDANLLQ